MRKRRPLWRCQAGRRRGRRRTDPVAAAISLRATRSARSLSTTPGPAAIETCTQPARRSTVQPCTSRSDKEPSRRTRAWSADHRRCAASIARTTSQDASSLSSQTCDLGGALTSILLVLQGNAARVKKAGGRERVADAEEHAVHVEQCVAADGICRVAAREALAPPHPHP